MGGSCAEMDSARLRPTSATIGARPLRGDLRQQDPGVPHDEDEPCDDPEVEDIERARIASEEERAGHRQRQRPSGPQDPLERPHNRTTLADDGPMTRAHAPEQADETRISRQPVNADDEELDPESGERLRSQY